MSGDSASDFVPVPDDDAISAAMALHPRRGFVAVAGTTRGQLIYLNLGFRTGHIDTIYLDETGAGHLLAALKSLAPAKAQIAASRVTLGDAESIEVQEGYFRRD